jgi:allantoinase
MRDSARVRILRCMKLDGVWLRSRHTVLPGGVLDAVVMIRRGRIAEVLVANGDHLEGTEDLGALWLLPGLVDTHVHINEPGRAEWEGFATATRAAAAGGITTLVDMPLNSVPATCNVAALEAKRDAARGVLHADVALWGGVVPGNAASLEGLAAAGVLGFKCFLSPSGVGEFENAGEKDLREAMPILARLGLPLLAHAESPRVLDEAAAAIAGRDPRAYATWLASRPPAAECEAIALLIALAKETGCRVHVVHLSAAEALPMIREARASGVPLTVETCPHYLVFDAESIADGATPFKCAPPIRSRANREALWEALREGAIDLIATDHSPCPPAMKQLETGDFLKAWGGITSLEMSLAAVWTEARARGFTAADVARWMSAAPAALAGLTGRKGAIAPGHDADLVAFDPDRHWVVEAPLLEQRHKVSPYLGRTLRGRAVITWLRGRRVAEEGAATGEPLGQLILDAPRGVR